MDKITELKAGHSYLFRTDRRSLVEGKVVRTSATAVQVTWSASGHTQWLDKDRFFPFAPFASVDYAPVEDLTAPITLAALNPPQKAESS